jgi:hypothetical protein
MGNEEKMVFGSDTRSSQPVRANSALVTDAYTSPLRALRGAAKPFHS